MILIYLYISIFFFNQNLYRFIERLKYYRNKILKEYKYMIDKIVPVIMDKAQIFDISELYDKNNPSNNNRYLPAKDSIIYGKDNYLYRVISQDSENLTYELELINLPTEMELQGRALVVSYGNDIIRLFYDKRNKPFRVTIEQRLVVYGESPSFYRLVVNPYDDTKRKSIAKYYDATGKYISDRVPLTRIQENVNCWTLNPCFITEQFDDDQTIKVQIFNEVGVEIGSIVVFTKESIIINDTLNNIPRIVEATIDSSQLMPDQKTIYILEKQALSSVNIFLNVKYEDGNIIQYPIDNQKVFLIGAEDFVSSYTGMLQPMLIKYYLSENETSELDNYNITNNFINVNFDVKVINNQIDDIVKVSVVPYWNNINSSWLLYYRIYGVDNNFTMGVSEYIKIVSGHYDGRNFSGPQEFILSLDLNKIDPIKYDTPTNYIQNVWINLFSPSATVKWLLSDATTSDRVYGQDRSEDRRPALYYDASLKQYFIPSSIFTNKQAVIESFYYDNNPPFNNAIQDMATEPTHFGIRDAVSNQMISNSYMTLDNYANAFSLKNGVVGNYSGTTIVVEFVNISGGVTNILYGSPVDCITGTYKGIPNTTTSQ